MIKFTNINESTLNNITLDLINKISAPSVLFFTGSLGAGKTSMIRYLLRNFGVNTKIKSPSYAIVESYDVKDFKIHHFDLYRISCASELEYIGIRDYFNEDSIICIEWPEKALECLPEPDFKFQLSYNGTNRDLIIRQMCNNNSKTEL